MDTKDARYHEAVVFYNDMVAEAAQKAADEVDHEVVEEWCRGLVKQHNFHAARHRRALEKLEGVPKRPKKRKRRNSRKRKNEVVEMNDIRNEQEQFAADQEARDAEPVYADQSTGESMDAQPVPAQGANKVEE